MASVERRTLYIVLTLVVMALSVFLLWYTELPDVRLGFEEISEYVKEHAQPA
jgi:hypothetical protein